MHEDFVEVLDTFEDPVGPTVTPSFVYSRKERR